MIRTDGVCNCNECGVVEEINPQWGMPNDWFCLEIRQNDIEREKKHLCSKKCIITYINKL